MGPRSDRRWRDRDIGLRATMSSLPTLVALACFALGVPLGV